jgi:hypothetical protein
MANDAGQARRDYDSVCADTSQLNDVRVPVLAHAHLTARVVNPHVQTCQSHRERASAE